MIHPQLGVYCQADGDLGDSGNRNGAMLVYFAESGKNAEYMTLLKNCVNNLKTPNGYIRGGEWNQPSDYSRDQASLLMLGVSYANAGKLLVSEYYKGLWGRSCTHQNGDAIGIGEIGAVIRYFELTTLLRTISFPFLYLCLCVLDLRFIVDYFLMTKIEARRWDMATLVVPNLVHAINCRPTPLIWLARKLYVSKNSTVEADMMRNHSLEKNGCVELQDATKFFFQRIRGEV